MLYALRELPSPVAARQRLVALAQVMGALDRSEDEVVVVDARRRMGEVQVVVGPIVIRLPGPLRAPALVPVVGAQIGHTMTISSEAKPLFSSDFRLG